jgi:hypothetical protein
MTDVRPPLLIFLDIDGTIVGDVSKKADEWCIVKELNKYITNNQLKHKRVVFNTAKLHKDLLAATLRPGLSSFISTVQKKCSPVEFFIYTASTPEWAKFLIKQIEHLTGVKFNRPLFTRPDCVVVSGGVLNKSLDKVWAVATRSISKIYTKNAIDNACAILVDNTDVGEKNLIHCPTYRGVSPMTMMNIEATITNHEVEDLFYRLIATTLGMTGTGYMLMRNKLYVRKLYSDIASSEITTILETVSRPKKDIYWKALAKVISQYNVRSLIEGACERITFAAIDLCNKRA